jgi:hypothetical protein
MTTLPDELARRIGRACCRCAVEFDGEHGQPVLCHTCHDKQAAYQGGIPKAWLEEKAP